MKKYNHLLLAIDVYEENTALIKEALHLAETYQSKLSLVHVAPRVTSSVPFAYDFQDAVMKHAQENFTALKTQFNLADSQLILRQGNSRHEIIEAAKEIKADLIICGSHGKHGLGLILGSTANGILHSAHTDVLTIRVDNKGKHLRSYPYKNIVLALDIRDDNRLAREQAVTFAKTFNAKLHIIHVVVDLAALGYYPAIEFDITGEAVKQVNAIVAAESLPAAPQDIHVKLGLPKQEILSLAKAVNADLIVVGSHGHKAFASALLGSTANAVLHGSEADVLVVRL